METTTNTLLDTLRAERDQITPQKLQLEAELERITASHKKLSRTEAALNKAIDDLSALDDPNWKPTPKAGRSAGRAGDPDYAAIAAWIAKAKADGTYSPLTAGPLTPVRSTRPNVNRWTRDRMKTQGSIKVALDASGNPWLIVGVGNGEYEAVQMRVVTRHRFDFSYEAVKYAKQQITPVDDAWKALSAAGEDCSTVPEPLAIPRAWENEDGDVHLIDGHVDPALAVLACVVTTMVDVGDEEAMQLLVGGPAPRLGGPDAYDRQLARADELLNSTSHIWLKQDPSNDEMMLPADPTDADAEAFTRVNVR